MVAPLARAYSALSMPIGPAPVTSTELPGPTPARSTPRAAHGDRLDEGALLVVELVGDARQLPGGDDGRFGQAAPAVAQPGARHRAHSWCWPIRQ